MLFPRYINIKQSLDIRVTLLSINTTWAGPQVQGRSASYGKSYSRDFSAGTNPLPGDPAENLSHRHSTPYKHAGVAVG
jgi:hypothetical protein